MVTALSYFMISRSIIDDIGDIAAGVGLSDVETRVGSVLPMQDMLVGPVFFLFVNYLHVLKALLICVCDRFVAYLYI